MDRRVVAHVVASRELTASPANVQPRTADASRTHQEPGIMATRPGFALNILRANGVTIMAQSLYENGLSFHKITQLHLIIP